MKTITYQITKGETAIVAGSRTFKNEKDLDKFCNRLHTLKMQLDFRNVGLQYSRFSDCYRKHRPKDYYDTVYNHFCRNFDLTKEGEKVSNNHSHSLKIEIR